MRPRVFVARPLWPMCVGLIVLACNRAPTLLVENVSGEGQEVNVWADKEVLATDTVAAGRNWCWQVPQSAQGRKVLVALHRPGFESGSGVSYVYHRAWLDTLVLNRSWTVRARVDSLQPATDAWTARAAQLEREALKGQESAIRDAAMLGTAMPTQGELDTTHQAYVTLIQGVPGAPEYIPRVVLTASSPCEATASKS